jgi:hypothetical protein
MLFDINGLDDSIWDMSREKHHAGAVESHVVDSQKSRGGYAIRTMP